MSSFSSTLEALVLLIVTATVFGGCVFPNIDKCRQPDDSSTCRCPCLPKCCPEGHYLTLSEKTSATASHGIGCMADSNSSSSSNNNNSSGLLPDVPLVGRLGGPQHNLTAKDLRFYHSVFPSCDGMEDAGWKYNVHKRKEFRLNADFGQEYVLHIGNGKHSKKMISNFANDGQREDNPKHNGDGDTVVVGFKPLMHFCFDVLLPPAAAQDESRPVETVAVTCPRARLTRERKIAKCCPPGHTYSNGTLQGCSRRVNTSLPWFLPINGHLYSEEELTQDGVLQYDVKKSLILPEVESSCNEAKYEDWDTFAIGPDARIHFTDTHLKLDQPLDFYCVDQLYANEHVSEEPEEEEGIYSDYYNYDDEVADQKPQSPSSTPTIGSGGSSSTHDAFKRMANYNCHNSGNKPHSMVALYCHKEILQIRKCCDEGQNLNLRARSCTKDLANMTKPWEDPIIYWKNQSSWDPVEGVKTNVMYLTIPNMKKDNLHVSTEKFKLLKNESLLFNGKVYGKNDFCLDFSFNYCEGAPSPSMRAIINDPDWNVEGASTIFGTNKEDSTVSLVIKRLGYPTSVVFLLLTLAVFIVLPELRQDLHGKMVICIVMSQVIVYFCLFIGTFPSGSVSRYSAKCVAQASLTYYFILCGFSWMSAMSYNIMTKFRASTILPKNADQRRFTMYSCFCFGIPLLLFTLVLMLDRVFDYDSGNNVFGLSELRPGFGEESCWFTSCSKAKALSVFLYGPISVMLVSNICMFAFAALRLFQMRQRVRRGKRTSFGRGVSYRPGSAEADAAVVVSTSPDVSATDDDDADDADRAGKALTLKGRIRRQLSSVAAVPGALAKKTSSMYQDNKESLSTYMKLFVAMGLTWSVEVIAWFLSSDDKPAPEALIVFLNLLNIFQGPIIFLVFTMKPSTAQKLKERLGLKPKKNRTKKGVATTSSTSVKEQNSTTTTTDVIMPTT